MPFSKGHFEQALHELYRASNNEKFASYKEVRKKYETSVNRVNIGIINTSFQELNFNPENKNKGALILKNNKLTFYDLDLTILHLESHEYSNSHSHLHLYLDLLRDLGKSSIQIPLHLTSNHHLFSLAPHHSQYFWSLKNE